MNTVVHTCSNCGCAGHNRRTCPAPDRFAAEVSRPRPVRVAEKPARSPAPASRPSVHVPVRDPVICPLCGGEAPAVRGVTQSNVVLAGFHTDDSGKPCEGRYRRARCP